MLNNLSIFHYLNQNTRIFNIFFFQQNWIKQAELQREIPFSGGFEACSFSSDECGNDIQNETFKSLRLEEDPNVDEMRAQQNTIRRRMAYSLLPSIRSGNLLNNALFLCIREFFPFNWVQLHAHVVFQMNIHGTSLSSLIEKCHNRSPLIIVVKTKFGLFGAVLSDPLKPTHKSVRYYGNSQTFVFHDRMCYKLVEPPNNNFISVSNESLMIGGPYCALFLSNGFENILSENCPTFNSPSFCSSPLGDSILDLEVYVLRRE